MEFLIIGIVTALNFIFIKKKFEQQRYEDGTFDIILFVCILFLFEGSFAGMVVGMVASLIISIYFYASPPKFLGPIFTKVKQEIAIINKQNSRNWDRTL